MQKQKFTSKCASSFPVWFHLFKTCKQAISWFYYLKQQAFTLISKQEQTNPIKEEWFQVSQVVYPIQGITARLLAQKWEFLR